MNFRYHSVKYLGQAIKPVVVLLSGLILAGLCGATSLTGTINSPNGTGANGNLYLSLSQQAALVSTGGCGGPIEVLPNYQVKISVVSGALQGSPTVYGNDCLLPNGTFYNVTFIDNNANVLMTDRWTISGSSVNVGTIVSVVISGTTQIAGAPGIVLTQPTATQTITQPGGTAFNVNLFGVTNTLTLPNGMICNSAGCSGAMTFSGNILIGNLSLGTQLSLPGGLTCTATTCDGAWKFASAVNFNGGLITLAGTNSAIDIGGGYIMLPHMTGGDVVCGPYGTKTWIGVRLDTAELQICVNGTMKKVQLN